MQHMEGVKQIQSYANIGNCLPHQIWHFSCPPDKEKGVALVGSNDIYPVAYVLYRFGGTHRLLTCFEVGSGVSSLLHTSFYFEVVSSATTQVRSIQGRAEPRAFRG